MLSAVVLLAVAAVAVVKVSHAGWPHINGRLWINKANRDTTIHGTKHTHNELLGGHGDDTIYAGDVGDVIWGDYHPSGQPTTQVDHLYGGRGHDFIYTSHGTNYVVTGGGAAGNVVWARFGREVVTCHSPADVVHLTHKTRNSYKLVGCRRVSRLSR